MKHQVTNEWDQMTNINITKWPDIKWNEQFLWRATWKMQVSDIFCFPYISFIWAYEQMFQYEGCWCIPTKGKWSIVNGWKLKVRGWSFVRRLIWMLPFYLFLTLWKCSRDWRLFWSRQSLECSRESRQLTTGHTAKTVGSSVEVASSYSICRRCSLFHSMCRWWCLFISHWRNVSFRICSFFYLLSLEMAVASFLEEGVFEIVGNKSANFSLLPFSVLTPNVFILKAGCLSRIPYPNCGWGNWINDGSPYVMCPQI